MMRTKEADGSNLYHVLARHRRLQRRRHMRTRPAFVPARDCGAMPTARMRSGAEAPKEAYLAFGGRAAQWNGDCVLHMLCRMTASFLAPATRAFLLPHRRASRTPQLFRLDHLVILPSRVVAAS